MSWKGVSVIFEDWERWRFLESNCRIRGIISEIPKSRRIRISTRQPTSKRDTFRDRHQPPLSPTGERSVTNHRRRSWYAAAASSSSRESNSFVCAASADPKLCEIGSRSGPVEEGSGNVGVTGMGRRRIRERRKITLVMRARSGDTHTLLYAENASRRYTLPDVKNAPIFEKISVYTNCWQWPMSVV